MPSIIIDDRLKKKFEMVRGKYLGSGVFSSITRAEALELMIDLILDQDFVNDRVNDPGNPFNPSYINALLKARKEKIWAMLQKKEMRKEQP